jgi:ABC-2 type transport system permease protein
MIGALLYLRLTSFKNQLLGSVRRLRHPRYLVGAIAGAAYFWFFFLRRMFLTPPHASSAGRAALDAGVAAVPALVIFTLFALFALFRLGAAWLAPGNRPGIAFTEAEIAFLFPAPVTRRTLVHFKLLGSQLTILVSSLLLTFVAGRGNLLGGNPLIHAIGWWVILSTLSLHTIGAAFTVTRLTDGGVSQARRQAAVTGLIVLIIAAVIYAVWFTAPAFPEDDGSPAALVRYATSVTDTGLLHWLLLPIKIVMGPFLASGWREFFLALGPALLLLAAHYAWVLRAETSFEEASIAQAEKRGRLIAAARAGNYRLGRGPARARREPFVLAPAGGRPEFAFLWKNLLSAPAFLNSRTFLVCAALIIAGTSWLGHGVKDPPAALATVTVVAVIAAVYIVLLGPQLARQDLRGDLAHSDILKTYPLRGWQVMLGEMLTPVAILTAMLWLVLLAAALALGPGRRFSGWLTPGLRGTAGVCLALITPLLCMLQLMIPNAATLLFPSWAQTARTRGGGIDVMGQRLIFVAGQLLVIILALLPAAGLGLLLWFAAHWVLGGAASTAVATAGVLGVLGLELCLGLWWLGRRFEKFDLSIETVR